MATLSHCRRAQRVRIQLWITPPALWITLRAASGACGQLEAPCSRVVTSCYFVTRVPLMRPVLLPGLPRVWRGPHTLQLGLHPGRAILLDFPDPRAAGLLDLLDGTRPEAVFLRQAATVGLPTPEAHDLLDSLRRAGLLLAGRHLLPPALTGPTRRRLTAEATALALTARGHPTVPIAAPAYESEAADGHRPFSDPQAPGGFEPSDRGGLSPAQILRRRMAAKVVVTGRGRLAAPIAV
ncbi:MAG: hypothetical protein QOE51_3732, partial [Actinoplanes sp.]|nr:hypothetical protein [Actinoplanes sp.]